MKRYLLIIVLLGCAVCFALPPELGVPELFNGVHDQYGYNFVNAVMGGRGNTGVSVADRIGVGVYNPAAYRSDEDHFMLEIIVKTSVDDFNTQYWRYMRDSSGEILPIDEPWEPFKRSNQVEYKSPYPISFFGIGFSPIEEWNIGISYHLNRSIEYNSLMRTNWYGVIVHTPAFYEHQFTLVGNRSFGPVTVGINNIILYQQFNEYRNEGKFDDLTFNEIVYRPQLGLLYENDFFQTGASYLPKQSRTIKNKYLELDTVYHTNIKAGVSANLPYQMRALCDIELNLYSETSDYLNDQLIYKFGFEKQNKNTTYRAGFMYVPGVFKGDYLVPDYSESGGIIPLDILKDTPYIGQYKKTDMNIITAGLSAQLTKHSYLNIAAMHDIAGNVKRTQLLMSIDLDFAALERNR